MTRHLKLYHSRFAAERADTVKALEAVWEQSVAARSVFPSCANFAQYACAQRRLVRLNPERVKIAERFMRNAGYVIGPPSKRGARTWVPMP